jgi:hypothetical protein
MKRSYTKLLMVTGRNIFTILLIQALMLPYVFAENNNDNPLINPKEGMYFLKTTSGYSLWSAESLVKIPRENIPEYKKLQQVNTIKVNSAKQEYESFQLVMTPIADMRNISLEFTDLTGPETISKNNIIWNLVEYINIKNVTRPGNRSGLWPDPLPEQAIADLKGEVNNPLWITMYTPNVLPGSYKGTINILQDGKIIDEVNIELNVWDFEIPAKTSVYTSASLHSPYYRSYAETEISKYESGDAKTVLKRYYKNLIEHRVKDYTHGTILPDIKIDISDRQNVIIDYTDFDEIAEYIFDLGMQRISFPTANPVGNHKIRANPVWYFGETPIPVFESGEDSTTFDSNTFSSEFLELFNQVYPQIVDHLTEKGWIDKVVLGVIDEPNIKDKATVNIVRNISQLFKDLYPDLSIKCTVAPISELYDVVTIWETHDNRLLKNMDQIRDVQAQGKEVAHYNNTVAQIDFSPMRMRTHPWLAWKYDLNGSLSWCRVANWIKPDSPWINPANGIRDQPGITVLLYPPRNSDETGPINSIRWENFRDGLEDFEYKYLLENKKNEIQKIIDKGELTASQQRKAVKLVSATESIISEVNNIVFDMPAVAEGKDINEPYTLEIELIRKTREQIANQIVANNKFISSI